AAAAWVAYPAGGIATALVVACLIAVERQPDEHHIAFAGGEQRRQLELLPAANVSPAETVSLHTKWVGAEEEPAWARDTEPSESFSFRSIDDEHGDDDTPAETTIAVLDKELPTPADTLNFHWPPGSGGGPAVPDPSTPATAGPDA